jgi:hypothetical protein
MTDHINRRYAFIGVNYGTPELIKRWVDGIKIFEPSGKIIVVDNFHSIESRGFARKVAKDLSIELYELENYGYSNALNYAIRKLYDEKESFLVVCGNIDITFESIPEIPPAGKIAYIPKVRESNKKNRNPFLTRFQRFAIPLYRIAALRKSSILYGLAIAVNKIMGKIPSKIWAVHGSLFCFDASILEANEDIFNNKSFLYGEELEFASYLSDKIIQLQPFELIAFHESHVATGKILKSHKDFIEHWAPSFNNWHERWKGRKWNI